MIITLPVKDNSILLKNGLINRIHSTQDVGDASRSQPGYSTHSSTVSPSSREAEVVAAVEAMQSDPDQCPPLVTKMKFEQERHTNDTKNPN